MVLLVSFQKKTDGISVVNLIIYMKLLDSLGWS